MATVNKNDFVEVKYSGYSEGKLFDSNIEEDLKKANSQAKAEQTIVIVGQRMLVPGFDNALEGKEVGKEYNLSLSAKEGFGERRRDLVKTIPLKVFREQRTAPQPGMIFAMDNSMAKILAVSGARVITDFNHPMAGKSLDYKFTIVRKVEDENEKVKFVLHSFMRFTPEYEITEKEVVVKGEKGFDVFVNAFNEKFKEFIGKPMKFELKEAKAEEKKETKEEGDSENKQ